MPSRSLYAVVSDRCVLHLFVPLPPAFLTGSPQEANISKDSGEGRILFLSAVFVVFRSLYQITLILVPPSIRPTLIQGVTPHTLFLGSKGWILPKPLHPKWSGYPVKMLLFAGGVFLDALLYYQ